MAGTLIGSHYEPFGVFSMQPATSVTSATGAALIAPAPTAWRAFLPALILFSLAAITNIMVPGLYMDAVNPDYMVVRVLNPGANVPLWVLPGTMLFGLYPVIGQIYHGAIPFYIGLPVYAVFGTGMLGVRLANLLFGLIVLAASANFLRAFRVNGYIAGFCLAALALDPGFLFSFRIQFYITLLPVAFILLSVALLEYRRTRPTALVAAASGLLAGLAVYGYFIYLFLVPAAAVYMVWCWRDERNRRTLILCWIFGLALGGSPYLVGMLLILRATGGVHAFLNFLAASLAGLAVADSPMSLVQRAHYFADMVEWTLLDVGPPMMMLGVSLPLSIPAIKLASLLGVPALGLAINLVRAPRSPGIFLLAGFFAGSAALTAVFGGRLWLQHFALLLPLAYLALALSLQHIASCFAMRRTGVLAPILAAASIPLLVGNVLDRHAVLAELTRTGGVGLASDAIDRFAEDSRRNSVPTRAFFPDWGIFMPFEMITRGHIPLMTDFTPQEARRTLCGGQDVLLALMDAKGPDRLPAWINEVGWGQPEITGYRQYDGVPVLTAIRWHAATPGHPACPP